jgi:beta-mannosidase
MALVRGATLVEPLPLGGWALVEAAVDRPEDVRGEWIEVEGPTTVAAALRSRGLWDFDRPRPLDAETWWFRCRLPEAPSEPGIRNVLRIGGLATLADVFLDGQHVLRSENMFHEHRLDLDALRASGGRATSGGHELLIRFAPLAEALAVKRPRPRWKTRLVSHQQLRWLRTSLVGRMPGWSPPAPPVGPWRPIALERWSRFVVENARLRASVASGAGVARVEVRLFRAGRADVEAAALVVGDVRAPLGVSREDDRILLAGEVSIPGARLWWPHTHGTPDRYPARVVVASGGMEDEIDLGSTGFRAIRLDTSDRGFALEVNGAPVFCRGACWTTTDVARLVGTPEQYASVLGRVRDAGMNMVRLSGTMFYEDDAFYDACDELGILVWQDFAFANMDYPIADEAFRSSVRLEATQLLDRLQARPCLAVLCGGSEVEQQAAMFGAPREIWSGPLFDEVLPSACEAVCPDVPYWPNSPSGGALPFHVDEGVGHYYGVGAYLRPFDDARRARVRFASECLAFANVPEDDLFPSFLGEGEAPVVHARWKQRTSKDHGSGWDFEDVRDHYVRLLFGVEPARVRYEDMERYLSLSRVTTGEVMSRVYGEFRRAGSSCRGALVWFLQDLWPGAGWGILDARGLPKSPYWFLRRALQPVGVAITDEGVNGLHVHAVNDRAEDVLGTLRVCLYRDGEVPTARGERDVVVPARSAIDVAVDGLLETFTDTAHAYRFGPPSHDLAVATLLDRASGATLAEAVWLVDFASPPPCSGLEATLYREGDGLALTVRAKRFAHAVTIRVPNHVPDDNYFDVPPSGERTTRLRPFAASKRPPSGTLSALNLRAPISLAIADGPARGGAS